MSFLSRRQLSPLSRRTFLKSTAVLAGATAFSARARAKSQSLRRLRYVAVSGFMPPWYVSSAAQVDLSARRTTVRATCRCEAPTVPPGSTKERSGSSWPLYSSHAFSRRST